MHGKLILIGGGEIAKGETTHIDKVIKSSADKGDVFAFFATAAGDSDQYIKVIEKEFGDHFDVIAVTEEKGQKFALETMQRAKVIYLGGGKTELLLDLFTRWDLVDELRAEWKQGTCIVGMSAGAQALAHWYIQEDEKEMSIHEGWNFIDTCVLVHANEENKKLGEEIFEQEMKKSGEFIAIEEGHSMVLDGSEVRYRI